MPIKSKKKVREVKAWALVRADGASIKESVLHLNYAVFPRKHQAKAHGDYVVPCSITYEIQ